MREDEIRVLEAYVCIERVLGVVGFGGLSGVLEEYQPIEIVLRHFHDYSSSEISLSLTCFYGFLGFVDAREEEVAREREGGLL